MHSPAPTSHDIKRKIAAAFNEITEPPFATPLIAPDHSDATLAALCTAHPTLTHAALFYLDDQAGALRATLGSLVTVTDGHAKGRLHTTQSVEECAEELRHWVETERKGGRQPLVILDGKMARGVTGTAVAKALIDTGAIARHQIVIYSGDFDNANLRDQTAALGVRLSDKSPEQLLAVLSAALQRAT